MALGCSLVFDSKEFLAPLSRKMRLPYYEIVFRNANVLASHKVRSYNSICLLHLLLWWIKPEPLVRVFFRPRPVRARAVCARKGAKTRSAAAGLPQISRKPRTF
ncbi:protein of unknown function [Paraburkholderia dioscoreae]|uniref:Uncharacterized protein n=1 Tax=Paraburkholderia dioscoreae TaxID=2604047 RepID=A0A5Q4YWA1_9BURK|nr:protein of unknown function [Paraburkholderia dioscoreae]